MDVRETSLLIITNDDDEQRVWIVLYMCSAFLMLSLYANEGRCQRTSTVIHYTTEAYHPSK